MGGRDEEHHAPLVIADSPTLAADGAADETCWSPSRQTRGARFNVKPNVAATVHQLAGRGRVKAGQPRSP
jgi:hypothetical protein